MSGQVANGSATLTAGQTFNIQPGAGIEWSIHNIYYDGPVSFTIIDGSTNPISVGFDSDETNGGYLDQSFNFSNTHYMQVKNTGTGTVNISFDGKQSN